MKGILRERSKRLGFPLAATWVETDAWLHTDAARVCFGLWCLYTCQLCVCFLDDSVRSFVDHFA